MINTTIQTSQNLQSIRDNLSSISVGDINVAGNVEGSIIVGNHNVIGDNNVVCEVNGSHGVVIDIHTPPIIKRRDAIPPPPRKPRGFTGRESELIRLQQYIQDRCAVYIQGHDGIGKTTLVKQAANLAATPAIPDGILYVDCLAQEKEAGILDIWQCLFDRLYASSPPVKVTQHVAQGFLSNTHPLVVLDHQRLPLEALVSLTDVLPEAVLIVTGQDPLFADGYETLPLTPLLHADAIHLFSEKSGIPLDPVHDLEIEKICRLLEDVPLAVTQIANAIHQNRLVFNELFDDLTRIQPPSTDKIQAAIERSFGLIYTRLDKNECDMLAYAAAAPGISVDRSWLESLAGGQGTSMALESLELLFANSPRLQLPDGIRQILKSGAGDLSDRRERLLRHLLEELKTRSLDFNFVADELGNILGLLQWTAGQQRWSDVIALGKGVDPYLALYGLWDMWGTVLKQVLNASQRLKDRAVQSWALHQLGTREIGVGSLMQAVNFLLKALSIRLSLGDNTGVAYTLHNLYIILPPPSGHHPEPPPGPSPKESSVGGIRGTAVIAEQTSGFLAGILWLIPGLILAAMIIAVLVPPYMILHKQANPMTYHPIGQVIQYTYTVLNPTIQQIPGPITVIDDDRQVACPPLETIGDKDGYFDWNEMIICSQQYTVTSADVERGSVTNTAFATAPEGEVKSSKQSVTIRYEDTYLSLAAMPDVDRFTKAGEEIGYTFIVKYLGHETVKGPVSITDNRMEITCPETITFGDKDDSLDPEERITCNASYTTTGKDVENGSVTDTAQARVGSLNSNEQTNTIPYVPPVSLILTKSADRAVYSAVDEEIHYTYTITNWTEGDLIGPVTVVDDMLKVDCPPVTTIGNEDDYLNVGEDLTCKAVYRITVSDMDRRSVTNTASASAGGTSSEKQHLTIYREPRPVLSLSKSANPEQFSQVGQEILYTYNIKNTGTVPITGPFLIEDDLVKADCPDTPVAGTPLSMLYPGERLTCTGIYVIGESDIRLGSVTNSAWAQSPDVSSEAVPFTIHLKPVPEPPLKLSKEANPSTYRQAGDVIDYTYTITNISPKPLYGQMIVRDQAVEQGGESAISCQLAESPQAVPSTEAPPAAFNVGASEYPSLYPEDTAICTAQYVITEADVAAGSVTNTAQAFVGAVQSNLASAKVYLEKLNLNITTNRDSYEKVGDEIQYSYSVTSSSPVPLYGYVSVLDNQMRVICPRFETVGNRNRLFEGEEAVICSGKYTVTQPDIDYGSITNTAQAFAGELPSDPVSHEIAGPSPDPALSLTSSVQPQNYDSVGQTMTYKYDVTNSGNVSLSKVIQIQYSQNLFTDCIVEGYQLAPGGSATCTRTYIISQSDFNFGNSVVSDNATAVGSYSPPRTFSDPPIGSYQWEPVFSNTTTTTITCPYPPVGWVYYIVEHGVNFSMIANWYKDYTMWDLQKRNCMGSSTQVNPGQGLYLPSNPPYASFSGTVTDSAGNKLANIKIILISRTGYRYERTTNGDGFYSFSNLPPGSYSIYQHTFYLHSGHNDEPQNFVIVPR